MTRPVTTCTPALLTMIAADWSAGELRAAIACLIDLLDARTDPANDHGIGRSHASGEDASRMRGASRRAVWPG